MNFWRSIPVLFLLYSACVGTDIINDDVEIVPARVEVSPSSGAVQVDSSIQFEATYFDSLGLSVADAPFQWRSEDDSIVEISSAGVARGLALGQTGITATSGRVVSDPVLLTVVADPNQVATVRVTPASLELEVGDTAQLAADALNLDGEEVTQGAFGWRSNNPAVATVDTTGFVRGVSTGATEIVAGTEGIDSNPVSVRVISSGPRSGTFTGRPGTSYTISGTATLLKLEDNRLELRLGSDFSSSSGPGLAVYLSRTNSVRSGSMSLGSLQATSGSQSYSVSPDTKLTDFDWVIIHCVPFNVTFGYAQLQ